MATLAEFRDVAERLRNWGRWGRDDQLGTLNHITPAKVGAAARLVRTGKVFPLGVAFGATGPQGRHLFRQNPQHLMTVDGGDADDFIQSSLDWEDNPLARDVARQFSQTTFRYNDDMVIMPLQAATQWDALSHVYYDGQLYNGYPAGVVSSMGAARCSIDAVTSKGIVSRGVLLDAVRHRGREIFLEHAEPITPEELDAMAEAQGVRIESGDIVLVHTGWYHEFRRSGNKALMVSGVSWRCAEWLHEHEVAAIACDNSSVEDFSRADVDGMFLPLHCLCLRDMGMMFGEYWDMSALAADCAEDGVYEFQLVASPLKVTGAVGSPVNPIALK